MPIFAELFIPLPCPKCRYELKAADGRLRFQWGEIPNSYELGETIKWRDESNSITSHFCIGDPKITNVLVIDTDMNLSEWRCGHCNALLDRPSIEIRNGTIKGIWIFEKGGFERKTGCKQQSSNYFQLDASGQATPLPDFDLT